MPAYRYLATFPRVWDEPRPDWPRDLVEQFTRIPGVVDASFSEVTAAWTPPEDGIRQESRRRIVEVVTRDEKGKAAEDTHRAVLEALQALKAEALADRVTVFRAAGEVTIL